MVMSEKIIVGMLSAEEQSFVPYGTTEGQVLSKSKSISAIGQNPFFPSRIFISALCSYIHCTRHDLNTPVRSEIADVQHLDLWCLDCEGQVDQGEVLDLGKADFREPY
jgi:hypothetical protein